jgi:hypothetical protein
MHFTNKFILKGGHTCGFAVSSGGKENINLKANQLRCHHVFINDDSGWVQLELLPRSDYVFELVDRLPIPLYH